MTRYFVTIPSENDGKEQEVNLEKYCQVERQAGFYPKASLQNSAEFVPATASFSRQGWRGCESLSGRIE